MVSKAIHTENQIPMGGTGKLVSGKELSEATVPIISVVTINFNGGATLEQTIKSVISQNYPAIEYIVMDGGSTDNSLEIIEKYNDVLSYWQSAPDGGISKAFNSGLEKTNGTWIGIINSDDWYEEGAFAALATNFENANVLYGAMRYWLNEQPDYIFEASHLLLTKEMTINHPTTFVQRDWYFGNKGVGVFKPSFKYAMDYDLMLRLRAKGAKFHYIPQVLANMRLNGASDAHWHKAYKEVFRAKIENNLPKYSAYTYYISQVSRTFLSRSLRKLGLNNLVAWYRKRFSMIKKTKG